MPTAGALLGVGRATNVFNGATSDSVPRRSNPTMQHLKSPEGMDNDWVRRIPGEGWFMMW